MEISGIPARRWLDLAHASEYADLPIKTLRRAIASGLVPVARPGRKQIVDVRDIDFWLTSEKRRIEQ